MRLRSAPARPAPPRRTRAPLTGGRAAPTAASLGRRSGPGLLVALALLAGACAPGEDTSADAGASPTFSKVSQDTFRYPEPVASINDVLPPGDDEQPWYVTGSILDPGTGRTRAAVWQADGGRSWEVEELEPEERSVSERLDAAARREGEIVAVGSAGLGDQADAAVWTSSDGQEWSRETPEVMGGRHEQWAFDVAVGEGGTLVAGGERAWGEVRPRLWHSTDGETWEAVGADDDGPFAGSGQESVAAVTAYGGGFAAVGWERVDGQQRGLAWFSPDGREWEKVDTPSMAGDRRHAVLSVAQVGNVLVAGGYRAAENGQGQPVVWRSEDGRSWGGASAPLPLHDGGLTTANDLAVRSLTVDGDQLIASGGARARPHVWRSGDGGQSWEGITQVPTSQFRDGIDLVAAARRGGVTVAIGSEPLVATLDDDRWVNSGADAFPDGGNRPVATSVVLDGDATLVGGYRLTPQRGDQRQQYDAYVWRRTGGGDFSAIEPNPDNVAQGFDAGAIEALSVYDGGYVAVGVEDFSVAERRLLEDRSPNGMLWISPDGQEWVRYAARNAELDTDEWARIIADTGFGDGDVDVDAFAAATVGVAADEPWVTAEPAGGEGTRALRGVAPLGEGFITVGSAFRNNDIDPISAISNQDGGITGESSGFNGSGTQRFNDVCSAGGRSVAVGVTGSDGRFDTAIHHRQDGQWQAAAATDGSFTSPGNQQAEACASSDEGFIVVGSDDSGGNLDARIWVSEDGLEWEEVAAGILGGAGDQEATAVTPVPDGGWLVAGTDTSGADAGIALWRLAPDGDLSRRDTGEPALRGPAPMTVTDVDASQDRTVIVGSDVDGIGIWETTDLDR